MQNLIMIMILLSMFGINKRLKLRSHEAKTHLTLMMLDDT